MLKKYIGNRAFYKMFFVVAIPIILQNFITNLVNMIDNVMVGSLGTEEVSAVAIVPVVDATPQETIVISITRATRKATALFIVIFLR